MGDYVDVRASGNFKTAGYVSPTAYPLPEALAMLAAMVAQLGDSKIASNVAEAKAKTKELPTEFGQRKIKV